MFKIGPRITLINLKMLKIRQIDSKINKKCVSYCKIPTQDKNTGLPLKILLLVAKPTGQILPSCPHNLQLYYRKTPFQSRRPFWSPLVVFLDFAVGLALRVVSKCPLCWYWNKQIWKSLRGDDNYKNETKLKNKDNPNKEKVCPLLVVNIVNNIFHPKELKTPPS